MTERLASLWPEIVLFITTCVVMVAGLSPSVGVRRMVPGICGAGLALAGVLALFTSPVAPGPLPNLMAFVKAMVAGVGLLRLLLQAGTVDREEEDDLASGRRPFSALRINRAEYYSFFLFSLTGLMLCASAQDLIWLFLALELTSLPTYVMVTISTRGTRSQEAGVKYFFLGAMGAGVFLYGFALLYGGTGTTRFTEMAAVFAQEGLNPIALAGLMLALVGLAFKIAAVPMHFYAADVYEGAASPVSAFLAFVPKTAGFVAILLLVSTVGGTQTVVGPDGAERVAWLPDSVRILLWVMAALTMTMGNVLAILQNSVKRMLAYSSVAHSGYMLVGVIAGPGLAALAAGEQTPLSHNGLAAVLFYLLVYGVMNLGAFGVLACLERRSDGATEGRGDEGEWEEIQTVDDLKGLCRTRPALGWTMVLCSLSLLGMPPILGFFGKVPLFTSGIAAGEIPLVIVLGVNSAIAAYYYLRLVKAPLLDEPDEDAEPASPTPFGSRRVATVLSAAGVILLVVVLNRFMEVSARAGQWVRSGPPAVAAEPQDPPVAAR